MIRAARTQPAPSALSALDKKGLTELDRASAHYATVPAPTAAYKFKVYKHDDVRGRLEAMFHGKCAYCESIYRSTAPMDVEHHRPKASPEGDPAHPGYWWLAADWGNLLPSCIHCNRRSYQRTVDVTTSLATQNETSLHLALCGKESAFPVTNVRATPTASDLAAEGPLLLDPCLDDPDEHLAFTTGQGGPISLVVPAKLADAAGVVRSSPRGAASIQVYGLNRLGLVQERTRVLRRLEFLSDLILDLEAVLEEIGAGDPGLAERVTPRLDLLIDAILLEMSAMAEPSEPFSAMVRHWMKDFLSRSTEA